TARRTSPRSRRTRWSSCRTPSCSRKRASSRRPRGTTCSTPPTRDRSRPRTRARPAPRSRGSCRSTTPSARTRTGRSTTRRSCTATCRSTRRAGAAAGRAMMRRRATLTLAAVLVAVVAGAAPAAAQACRAPRALVDTIVGIKYCADPTFDAVVASQIQRIRGDVRAARQAGRLVIYASTPISPRGGGVEKVNVEIAASVKARLEKAYGGGAWVLDPGVYQLPSVAGKAPGGDDYMVRWTRVLAGDDGAGRDFDMAHFTGPGDMRAFFGCGPDDLTGCLARWLAGRTAGDAGLRRVADDAEARRAFLRYYAMRASAAYSAGAHDEWNIVVRINRKRTLGDQLAVFFDGRAVSP